MTNNTATPERAFSPVHIGISPAGVEWIAYKPENVGPMRLRLAQIWKRHNARQGEGAEFADRLLSADAVRLAYRARREVQANAERARDLVRFGRLAEVQFSDDDDTRTKGGR